MFRRLGLAMTFAICCALAGCGSQPAAAPEKPLAAPSAGSGPSPTPTPDVGPQGFLVIPVESSNLHGGGFEAGVMIVSRATGLVTSCWQKCVPIGQVAVRDGQELLAVPLGGLQAYITNMATGEVTQCEVKSDDFVEHFLGGRCMKVGVAGQTASGGGSGPSAAQTPSGATVGNPAPAPVVGGSSPAADGETQGGTPSENGAAAQ